jgi:3-oxoacyl-[acyl-carrier protein] reductase
MDVKMEQEFQGRVALVTGGSRGMGRASAILLAQRGADVAISYRSRKEEAKAVVEEIQSLGRKALSVPCDVSRPHEVQAMVDVTRETLGPISLLVHCGAISTIADHDHLDYETWSEMIDVNLTGTYLVVFAVKDQMIQQKDGRIVTLSSIAALRPRPVQIHYASAKAGVIAFTRSCADALAPHNIRVNCIAPGLVDTEMMRVLPPERIESIIETTPMRRAGQPEEIAAMVRFLLSDDSSFTTGQTLVASGGRVTLP